MAATSGLFLLTILVSTGTTTGTTTTDSYDDSATTGTDSYDDSATTMENSTTTAMETSTEDSTTTAMETTTETSTTTAMETDTENSTTTAATGNVTVSGVSYSDITANSTIMTAFETACQTAIASTAGVATSYVSITLEEGSVLVTYTITLPVSDDSELTSNARNTLTSAYNNGSLAGSVVTGLDAIPGLPKTGNLTAIATPPTTSVTTTTTTTTAAPEELPYSKASLGASRVYAAVFLVMSVMVAAHRP